MGHVARMGQNMYTVLVEKPEGKRQLAKPRCRWNKILKWILTKCEKFDQLRNY